MIHFQAPHDTPQVLFIGAILDALGVTTAQRERFYCYLYAKKGDSNIG